MTTTTDLTSALATHVDGDIVAVDVEDGWDVFGVPHGGYLLALGGAAVLARSGAPDIFTITAHFLRKAVVGPMQWRVTRIGGSRRFTSWHATAVQDGETVMSVVANTGDRDSVDGPAWSDETPWEPVEDDLTLPAGHPDLTFPTPNVAANLRLRLDGPTSVFATGGTTARARLRAQATPDHVDQLVALIASDVTPPALWNALPPEGWVPTVELTAHVRARPVTGPLTIQVDTHHVDGGFFEEDALVRDAAGRLVVQSRQLARTAA